MYQSPSEASFVNKKGQESEDITSLQPDDEIALAVGMRRGTSFASEKDFDQMSVSSRSTAYQSRATSQDESLSLVAHGIENVGKYLGLRLTPRASVWWHMALRMSISLGSPSHTTSQDEIWIEISSLKLGLFILVVLEFNDFCSSYMILQKMLIISDMFSRLNILTSSVLQSIYVLSGGEISNDLVQMLQKKLNDAVLDILSDNLTRNPMSKLTPEDVQVGTLSALLF